MAVKIYSKAKDGKVKVGKFFSVGEFACKDSSDKILIDDITVGYLDTIREHFNNPCVVNSGYRTPAYNAKVGGAKDSYHMKGQAADVSIATVHPADIARFAESLGVPGIGLYDYGNGSGFVHVDSRSVKYYWKQTGKNGSAYTVSTHGWVAPKPQPAPPTLRKGSTGKEVKTLQTELNKRGASSPLLVADGAFGLKTEAAVKKFQKLNGLTADGIAGPKTWGKLGVSV